VVKEENIICFSFVVDLHENRDPEAWNRLIDAFIDAVEKEGGSAAGGVHQTGTNPMCQDCGPIDLCFECRKKLDNEQP